MFIILLVVPGKHVSGVVPPEEGAVARNKRLPRHPSLMTKSCMLSFLVLEAAASLAYAHPLLWTLVSTGIPPLTCTLTLGSTLDWTMLRLKSATLRSLHVGSSVVGEEIPGTAVSGLRQGAWQAVISLGSLALHGACVITMVLTAWAGHYRGRIVSHGLRYPLHAGYWVDQNVGVLQREKLWYWSFGAMFARTRSPWQSLLGTSPCQTIPRA